MALESSRVRIWIIFSTSWSDHQTHLESVLQRIQKAGLTIKKRKCQFAMAECVYLGHRVGNGKVAPEALKVEVIRQFPTPHTKKQVWVSQDTTISSSPSMPHLQFPLQTSHASQHQMRLLGHMNVIDPS